MKPLAKQWPKTDLYRLEEFVDITTNNSNASIAADAQPATPRLKFLSYLRVSLNSVMLLLVAVISVHILAIAIMDRNEQAVIDAGKHRVVARTEGAVVWLRRSMEGINLCLDLLQSYQTLSDENDPSALEVQSVLQQISEKRRFDISAAVTVDPSGVSTFSTTHIVDPINKPERPTPRHVGTDHNHTYVSDPFIGPYTHEHVVAFSRHLSHSDGSDAGVASVTIDYLALSNHLGEMLPAENEAISVSRSDGSTFLQTRWKTAQQIISHTLPEDTIRAIAGKPSAFLRKQSSYSPNEILVYLTRVPEYDLIVGAALEIDGSSPVLKHRMAIQLSADAAAAILSLATLFLRNMIMGRRKAIRALRKSQLKAEQAALRQTEINQSIDALPGAIYRARLQFDGSAKFSFISSGFERLSGWKVKQLLKMPGGLYGLYDPPNSAAEIATLAHTLAQNGVVMRDHQIRLPSGTWRWIRISEQSIGNDEQGVDIAGLVTDIEVEYNAMMSAKSSARMAALGEVATALAPELSQPLATISLMAENATFGLRRDRKEYALEKIGRIPSMAARAKVIIDHLRLFGRNQEVHPQPVDVAAMVEGTLLLTEQALQEANVAIEIALQPNLPQVLGGLVLLEQVLLNLFINARDAMDAQLSSGRKLTISARALGDKVEISISDTGTGIPERVLPKLFEPFFTTKPIGYGTGLGLSICHGIITSFGGTISAHNTEFGAVFVIVLPVAHTQHPSAS